MEEVELDLAGFHFEEHLWKWAGDNDEMRRNGRVKVRETRRIIGRGGAGGRRRRRWAEKRTRVTVDGLGGNTCMSRY